MFSIESMKVEEKELTARIADLRFFTSSPKSLKVTGEELLRIKNQIKFMVKYQEILKDRIRNYHKTGATTISN